MEPVTTASSGWILVVDDHLPARYALGRTLRGHGYAVREAANGTEALRMAEDGPDLVLLDVHLPDLSGLEVCRRLRSSERTAALPIVHMSASFTEKSDRVRGLVNGADAYLVEPIDTGELLATIEAVRSIRRAERRARAAEEEWASTFEAIRDGLAVLGPDGAVLRHNEAFARTVGAPGADLRGAPAPDLFRARFEGWEGPERHPSSRTTAERRLHGTTWRCLADPVAASEGGVRHVVILSDVTQVRRFEEERQRLTDELARSNDELERFAYAVSHDLQEPLRTVALFSGLLEKRLAGSDPETAELLEFVVQGARRMSGMVDGVLGIARLGRRPLERAPVDLGALLDEVRADLARAIAEAGAQIEVGPLPTVEGDAPQLRLVLQNLLGNALKFRRPGAPCRIAIAAARVPEGWRMTLRDDGVGIPSSQLERVFGFFQRAHPEVPGVGLGLTLARRIVERHGGRLWLESHEGRGTAAHVLLPAG